MSIARPRQRQCAIPAGDRGKTLSWTATWTRMHGRWRSVLHCSATTRAPGPLFDTRAALAWDDRGLFVGFWMEDRDIQATCEEDSHEVRQDSYVGVIITGPGAYYDLVVNPLGATSEMCYIWKEAYRDDVRFHVPEFDLAVHRPEVLGGHTRTDIRAMRWAFSDWRLPGLQASVKVDGDPGRRDRVDRGWNVELALPWEGFRWLADGRAVPPAPGDVWRYRSASAAGDRPARPSLAGHVDLEAPGPGGWPVARNLPGTGTCRIAAARY